MVQGTEPVMGVVRVNPKNVLQQDRFQIPKWAEVAHTDSYVISVDTPENGDHVT